VTRRDLALAGHAGAAALALVLALSAAPSRAADEGAGPKGVNPKDLVTKIDVIARRDSLKGDITLDSVTLKYDRGLDEHWGIALEVPLARFSAPGVSQSGLAESKLKFRRVENLPWGAFLVGGEFVLPTESQRLLGSGKWQVNPSVGAVLSLTPTIFAFGGYQHFFSVAGRDDAPKINQSQPRILVAKTSAAGWWLMSDLKYTYDHESSTKTIDTEIEAGRMVARDWAVSLRVIDSALDSTRRWGAVVVLRHLF
jgi:hypothetical protein